MKITKSQLVKLQTLWSQYARRSLDVTGDPREERLRWANELLGTKLSSFSELTAPQAKKCIEQLNLALGMEPNQKKRGYGSEGRKRDKRHTETLASAADLARIQSALERLRWDQARFDAWLRSPSSPLRHRGQTPFSNSAPQIKTTGQANRVWWALKSVMQREGVWEERTAS